MLREFTIKRAILCLAFVLLVLSASHAQTDSLNLDSVFKTLNLQEVEVKAKKIRHSGDTLTYNASSYISKDDKVLEDLLRKMPGISVSPDGQVSYNGKWISDFYIEGADLLGGRYTIATRNINADDIASVQVMENHQEAKLLQGKEWGDSPAVNIKLKNRAMGVWASNLDAKAGVPTLARDITVNLMNFRPKSQNISFGKTNNTGKDIRREIKAPADMNGDAGTGMVLPSKPGIDDAFSYLNDSHSISANQLQVIDKERQLAFNINYLHDRERRSSAERSDFLVSADSTLSISEDNASDNKMNFLNGNVNYKVNSSRLYLKEALSVSAAFNSGHGIINTGVTQHLDNHSLEVTNRITAKKKRDNGGVAEYSSTLRMADKDGKLELPAGSQDIHRSLVHTTGSMSLFSGQVPFVMYGANMSAEMKYERVTTGTTRRDNRMETAEPAVSLMPRITLHHGNSLQLNLFVPVGIRFFHVSDMNMGKYGKLFLTASPKAFFSYDSQHRMQYDLAVTYEQSLPEAMELLTGRYIQNYRTTFANSEQVKAGLKNTFKAKAAVSYKDVVKMTFASMAVTYAAMKSPYTEAYRFIGIETGHYLHPAGSESTAFSVEQTLSKGFYRFNSKFQQGLTLARNGSRYIIEGESHKGVTNVLRASLGYSASPGKWLALSLTAAYTVSQPYTDGRKGDKTYRTLTGSSSVILWAGKRISFNTQARFHYCNYVSGIRSRLYVNECIEYHLGRAVVSLECINAFNSKVFRTVSDNGVTRFSREYQLRGRTVMAGIRVKVL